MLERSESLASACAKAAVAELAYPWEQGLAFDVCMPLRWGDRPVLPLTYAREDLARRLVDAPAVTMVVSDSRMALKGWEPLAASVRMGVVEDPDGKRFQLEGLLGEELVKHPPSRQLADTPLLRREHWWYMPRLLVTAEEVIDVWPVGSRTGDDALLASLREGSVDVDTVAVEDWEADPVVVRSLVGRPLDELDSDAAALFGHDFSAPDFDRRARCQVSGQVTSGRLAVRQRQGSLALERPPGLLRRLRSLRDLERACRAGMRARGADA